MTKAEQDAYFDGLVRNDPILRELAWRNVHAFRDPASRPEDRSLWLGGQEYQQLRNARLAELGIDPNYWNLQTGASGEILGTDYQNFWERHDETITKIGAFTVFGLMGGNVIANLAGGGAGAGAGAGSGAGTSTTAAAATGGGMGVMDWIMAGLGLAGAGMNIFGQLQAGNAAAAIANQNAALLERQAGDAMARGGEEVDRLRQQVSILMGKQRAGFAGQNVDVNVGSPTHVQEDARWLGEQDAKMIMRNAAREAWGLRAQADIVRQGGQIQQSQSRWGAASTALAAGTSLLNARYGFA